MGDSVVWSQGLITQNKYAYRVAQKLRAPSTSVDLQAHSGAIIGASLNDNGHSIDREIPAPAPKIAALCNKEARIYQLAPLV